jgi:hypothetical protein
MLLFRHRPPVPLRIWEFVEGLQPVESSDDGIELDAARMGIYLAFWSK